MYQYHLTTITIQEVAKKIHVKDEATALNWLKAQEILVTKKTKPHRVFEIEVDVAIDKEFALHLKKKYPNDWEERYKIASLDSKVSELVIADVSNIRVSIVPITKVKCTTTSDNKLLKKLIG